MGTDYSLIKSKFLWFVGMSGLIGSIAWTIHTQEWIYWVVSYVYFRCISVISNNISLHRYFAHKSFKTGPKRHQLLVWITLLSGVGSPFIYAIHHRHHHKYSDKPQDLHSPRENFWRSFLGTWVLKDTKWWIEEKKVTLFPRDLIRDPSVKFITEHYHKMWLGLVALAWLIGGFKFCVFFMLAPVGWNLFQGAMVNCIDHLKLPGSYRNYDTDDHSYNNKVLNWFLLGEGLHNNHHQDQSNYKQAHKADEHDPAGWIIEKFFKVD